MEIENTIGYLLSPPKKYSDLSAAILPYVSVYMLKQFAFMKKLHKIAFKGCHQHLSH